MLKRYHSNIITMETLTLNLTGATKLQALTVFANNEWTKVYLCVLVLKIKLKCKYKYINVYLMLLYIL